MELAGNKCQLPLHRRTRACRPRLRWTMPPKGGTFWVGDAGGVAARARAGGEVAAERRSARQHSVRAEGGAKQRLTPPVWGLGSWADGSTMPERGTLAEKEARGESGVGTRCPGWQGLWVLAGAGAEAETEGCTGQLRESWAGRPGRALGTGQRD